jgi:hypothetical protein
VIPFRALAGLMLALAAAAAAAQDARQPAAGEAAAQPPAAPAMGRLFYTPQKRTALDAERRALLAQGSRPTARPKTAARPLAAEPRPVERTYTLQGIVKRSDGESTVWINNEAVHERHAERGIAVGTIGRDSVAVKLPEGDRRVQLRVGQSVNSGSGRVRELYKGRPLAREAGSPVPEGASVPEGSPPKDPRS